MLRRKLTNEEIAFIAELRTEGISWIVIAKFFKFTSRKNGMIASDLLEQVFHYRMKVGFK